MGLPNLGDIAPEFELSTDRGETVRLSDLRGKRVVLFFYPRADTPTCTVEACGFRDDFAKFEALDAVVLGISPDTVKDQSKFSRKFSFPYPLLADAEHEVAEAFGVWAPKTLFGREYMGVVRTTFIIDEHGRISHVYPEVNAKTHSQEVLAALQDG